MKGVLEGHKLPKALPLPEKAAYGQIEVNGCINLGQIMAAVGDPVTRNVESFKTAYEKTLE